MVFGLQLYTVRRKFNKDWKGTLRYVRRCGYGFVELFDYLGVPADELAAECDSLGLSVIGAHTARDILETRLDEVIGYCKTTRVEYVILPWAKLESLDDMDELVGFLNETGKTLAESGLKFLYHNHFMEFKIVGKQTFLEHMMERTNPEYVNFEYDICFMAMMGYDPKEFISEHSDRGRIIHLKDYLPGFKVGVAEIGKGIIEFKPLIDACIERGLATFVVEQEFFPSSCFESIRESLEYLNEITDSTIRI